MKDSFEYIEDGDILYYALCVPVNELEGDQKFGYTSKHTIKYNPIVGQFKVSGIEHIYKEMRDVAEHWEEPDYQEFDVNKIKFDITPYDVNGEKIVSYLVNNLCYNSSITMDFTFCNNSIKGSMGRGTFHNLFLCENDAIESNIQFMSCHIIPSQKLEQIIDAQNYNTEQLEKISKKYGK